MFCLSFSHIHTCTLSQQWQQAALHAAGLTIWCKLGFIVLPKDTSTCAQEELGFDSPTLQLVGNLL